MAKYWPSQGQKAPGDCPRGLVAAFRRPSFRGDVTIDDVAEQLPLLALKLHQLK
jgi:hypothetical protein